MTERAFTCLTILKKNHSTIVDEFILDVDGDWDIQELADEIARLGEILKKAEPPEVVHR